MPIPTPITLGDQKAEEKIYNFDHGKPLDLTSEAIEQVKTFTEKNSTETAGKKFRVYVEGGGCSGMQYGFTFAAQTPDDLVIACDDIEILLDKNSEQYVKGAVVDYVADFRGAGFIVKNPVAKGECGCGISFAV